MTHYKPKNHRKEISRTLRLTKSEDRRLRKMAVDSNMTVADFLRRLLTEEWERASHGGAKR